MLLAALRRFGLLVLFAVAVTTAGSLLFGALLGYGLDRSLSLGFYFVGCFLLVCGFFVGNRGPARVKSESASASLFGMFGDRRLRWATPGEQYETITSSAVFVSVGILLIVIGAIVDSRQSLY